MFSKKQTIFVQGDPCDAVFYIKKAGQMTVLSHAGKEATTGILNEGYFFGESCLTGRTCPPVLRHGDDRLLCDAYREKKPCWKCFIRNMPFSDMFVAYLLTRNIRYEEDLLDQFFNTSEKRLARILLLLAQFGKQEKSEVAIPKISQETLAEMVGTTRSRVSFFMNRFRKLGFVRYNGELEVHSSLSNIFLRD